MRRRRPRRSRNIPCASKDEDLELHAADSVEGTPNGWPSLARAIEDERQKGASMAPIHNDAIDPTLWVDQHNGSSTDFRLPVAICCPEWTMPVPSEMIQAGLFRRFMTSHHEEDPVSPRLVDWWGKMAYLEASRIEIIRGVQARKVAAMHTRRALGGAEPTRPSVVQFHAKSLFFDGENESIDISSGDSCPIKRSYALNKVGVDQRMFHAYTLDERMEWIMSPKHICMMCKWYSDCFATFQFCFGKETRLVTTRLWKTLERAVHDQFRAFPDRELRARQVLTEMSRAQSIDYGFYNIFVSRSVPKIQIMALHSAMYHAASRASTAEYLHHPSLMIARRYAGRNDR